MVVLRAIAVAFGMYSQLPMPNVEWDEKSLPYALCAFPLVGLVQAALCFLWGLINMNFPLPPLIIALGFLVIPLAFNGGVHLDGLSDTADALASNASVEKQLEIMKDPHVGSFGVLAIILHILALFTAFSVFSLSIENLLTLLPLYALSRSLSGWAVVVWPSAKKDGIVHTFRKGSAGKKAEVILLLHIFLYIFLLVLLQGVIGIIMVALALLGLVLHRRMTNRYGGVTGDLAGWFLQQIELVMLFGLIIGGWYL